jgi:hypothetical protein
MAVDLADNPAANEMVAREWFIHCCAHPCAELPPLQISVLGLLVSESRTGIFASESGPSRASSVWYASLRATRSPPLAATPTSPCSGRVACYALSVCGDSLLAKLPLTPESARAAK